mgnify:CR=1 FL=1
MKSISPERVEKYEQFMNFYADVLKKIKKNQFYEITTHKFMVIARKNDMKTGKLKKFPVFLIYKLKNVVYID